MAAVSMIKAYVVPFTYGEASPFDADHYTRYCHTCSEYLTASETIAHTFTAHTVEMVSA